MAIKNPKDLLLEAAKLPAALEAKLPEGAPKLSTMLTDATGKIPTIPDFPIEIPDLPAVPELPEMPTGLKKLGGAYVTSATVTPALTPVTKPLGKEILS